MKNLDLISKTYYNRETLEYGMYKVIDFVEERGKSKVEYYLIKFKDTGNEYTVPVSQILKDTVKDMIKKKKDTVKRNRVKKKEAKEEKRVEKKFVNIEQSPNAIILDIGTISTGYCIYQDNKMVDYGYIFCSSKKCLTTRINYMKHEILKLCDKYSINCSCCENLLLGQHNDRMLSSLSKIHGVVMDTFYELSIDVSLVEPIEWKSYLDINRYDFYKYKNKREESKMKTLVAIKADFNIDCIELYKGVEKEHYNKKVWEDVADAIGIGKFFIENRIITGHN